MNIFEETNKPKLLIMASLFFPQKNSGGPPVSIKNLIDGIYKHFEIYVISKNYEINGKEPLEGVVGGWVKTYFGKAFYFNHGTYSFFNVFKIIKEIAPDIIYQNSFFNHDDVFPLIVYKILNKNKVKVIVNPRGEFLTNALKNNSFIKKLYIKLLVGVGARRLFKWQVLSENERENLSLLLYMDKDEIEVIPNLTCYKGENMQPTSKDKSNINIVYLGRIHPHKNLHFALKSLKGVRGNINFDIYGPVENNEYWQMCLNEIESMNANIMCRYMGNIDNKYVPDTLSQYHLLYSPSYSEAYGQSIVEAMLTKTPVLISDQTPWTDVYEKGCGYALGFNEISCFSKVLQQIIDMGNEEYQDLSFGAYEYIRKKIDFEKIVSEYLRLFREDNCDLDV